MAPAPAPRIARPIYLPTTLANGFLPDLDALDDATLARTVAIYHRLAGQSAGCGGFAANISAG